MNEVSRGSTITDPDARIHIDGNVSGQVAVGSFVYQAQAPGGIVNQIVVPEPIRTKPRPIDVRPRRNPVVVERTGMLSTVIREIGVGPVQIVGGDGWGKTTLVSQIAYLDSIESYRDGVAVVSAWGLPVEDIEQAIFEAFFECTLPDTKLKATPGQLRTSFAEITAAIAVDDLDVPRQHVDRIIDACARCGFLSTASSQTMWSGGSVLDLAPLEPGEAIGLFEQRLGRTIGSAEREAVARFSSSVSGYPLAVVVAAAAVRRAAVAIDSLQELADSSDPIAAVHEEVRETLTLSETRVLSVLAALDGSPLPPEAVRVASGVDEAVADLERLRHDGLLQVASPTYRIPTGTTALLSLPDAYSATVSGLARWSRNEPDAAAIASAGPAISSAIRTAVRHDDFATAIDLGRSADAGLALSGRWGVWDEVVQGVGRAASRSDEAVQTAWSLHQRGTRALALGETSAARDLLEQAAAIRERIGDLAGLEVTRHNLALLGPSPPVVQSGTDNSTTKAQRHGRSGWATVIVVAAIVAIVALVAVLFLDGDDDSPEVVTTQPANGNLVTNSDSIDFPELRPGDESTAEIELVNIGPGPLEVEDVRLEDGEAFRVDTDCGPVEPDHACLVVVTYSPGEPGSAGDTVVIEHTGGNGRLAVPVFGIAIDPPDAFLIINPVVVDFGLVPRSDEQTHTLKVTNEGDLDVRVEIIRFGSRTFAWDSACATLQPGRTCEIDVNFVSAEPGTFEDTLIVEHTAHNPAFEIPVSAVVAQPPNLTIEIVESFDAEGWVESGGTLYWMVPVVAEITNQGQVTVEDEFDMRFELKTGDDVTAWRPAVTPFDSLAQSRIAVPVGVGETIVIEAVLGFDTVTHPVGSVATIRAQVDSCFAEEFMPWPPCRIEESNEEDNTSPEFRVRIVGETVD